MNSCPKCYSCDITITKRTGSCNRCGHTSFASHFNGLHGREQVNENKEYLVGGSTHKVQTPSSDDPN